MAKTYDTVKCSECDLNLESKIQYYDKKKVYCEICWTRVLKGEEVPERK